MDTSGPAGPFFVGAARGVLLVQRCEACGTRYAPGRERCQECLGASFTWVEAAGTGTVVSYSVVHRAPGRAVPYHVAVVELAEGPRLVTAVAGAAPEVGLAVRVRFEVRDGIPMPVFAPE